MVIRGRVQNGVVVLAADSPLPVGIEVDVVVRAAPGAGNAVLVDTQRQRALPIGDRSAALPDEALNEPFRTGESITHAPAVLITLRVMEGITRSVMSTFGKPPLPGSPILSGADHDNKVYGT